MEVVAEQGEYDAEDVEDDVGHGVLSQSLHATVLDQPTPKPTAELDENGAGHDDDRREAELHD